MLKGRFCFSILLVWSSFTPNKGLIIDLKTKWRSLKTNFKSKYIDYAGAMTSCFCGITCVSSRMYGDIKNNHIVSRISFVNSMYELSTGQEILSSFELFAYTKYLYWNKFVSHEG